MGKTYIGRKGARDLERDAKPGMRIYYVNDHANVAGQFEAQTYSTLFCTHRGGILKNGWMFSHGSDHHGKVFSKKGTISAEQAVLYLGGVSATPPPGLRELASPEPDCRDEGWASPDRGGALWGAVHTDDIKKLEYEADRAKDQYDADRKAGRRRGWRS